MPVGRMPAHVLRQESFAARFGYFPMWFSAGEAGDGMGTEPVRAETVAVLGGRGMLGTALVPVLEHAGFGVMVYDLPEWSICSEPDLRRALDGAAAVANCAAYTNVDGAESEPAKAAAVNTRAVARLGEMAAASDVYVLHVSTDFVFDGRQSRPYTETDTANPLSVYGATKLDGERGLTASGCEHAILRVQWTYGAAAGNFVTKILDRAAHSDVLRVVDDQVGAPTWTGDVAAVLRALLEQRHTGLLHYAAAGAASRFDVAAFILRECGFHGVRLERCQTADFATAAVRPLNSCFDCRRIDRVLARPRPDWHEPLAAFLHSRRA